MSLITWTTTSEAVRTTSPVASAAWNNEDVSWRTTGPNRIMVQPHIRAVNARASMIAAITNQSTAIL